MRTAYERRAYPDPGQQARPGRTFGCVRLVWNRTLAERHTAYHQRGEKTSHKQTDAALTGGRRPRSRRSACGVRELLRRACEVPEVQVPHRASVGALHPQRVPRPRRPSLPGQATGPAPGFPNTFPLPQSFGAKVLMTSSCRSS
ncbi:helix-turn-helix domain-containing protein [Nocardiopsis halotolerans]|uniref:helix-turn-helix domain-containing protein n=1 Tax=Nocardiopsis halotolerans TaxID=124252 RepID=UPI00373AE411